MSGGFRLFIALRIVYILWLILSAVRILAAECPYLYGIHDHDPAPTEYLNHIKQYGVTGGWITATVAVGHNPNDQSGVDFTPFANAGHTVICRINNGYCDVGTIPLPEYYADFAQRCANFVSNSPGCNIWVIGNETNLAVEWPPRNGHKAYVSPESYAQCFRLCYNAIKAVRPNDKVVCQAIAPFGGPYGSGTVCGYTHDACPINWVTYMNQMLTAIKSTGGIDGIALHINSRGYTYADIHSTQKVNAGGQMLYFSFYVYKDWIDYGIPTDLYHLPLYVTECNGVYYWKGGHPENPTSHYEPGWMQEIYAEINRYNQQARTEGKPIFRCINMYRWCAYCDDWNIDGASNPYKSQILSDLDQAVSQKYRWPDPGIIIDNSDSQFTVISGTWNTGTSATDKYGADYRWNSTGTGEDVVRWTPNLLQSGNYEVMAWYSAGTNRAVNAPFTVVHKDGSNTILINQTINGGKWNSLGTFPFNAGQSGYVSLSDNAEPSKVVIADAVRWEYKSPLQLPGTITGYVRNRNGSGIYGATVSASPGGYSTTTNSSGEYTLTNVMPGTYTVTASKPAYCYQTIPNVTVVSGGTTNQDFTLTMIGNNMLLNGDFEGGFQANGVANYWTPWISPWSNPITYADSTSPVHGGSHAQKWGRPDRYRVHGGICQSVGGVTPGRQYTVSGWIRFQATDPGAWAEIGYDLTGQTSNGEASTVQYTKLESGGQNTWLYYTKTVTATTDKISIFYKFGQYFEGGTGPSWAYADDAEIYEVPTPPVMVYVNDDGVYQTSTTSIHGSWLASDPESGIQLYSYAISTTPDESGIIPGGGWLYTGAPQGTRTGLSLVNGQVYYILVKARNPHNQWSDIMASDGIRVVQSVPSLAEAKKCPDGRWVEVQNLVCTLPATANCMGVRQSNSYVGIKLTQSTGTLPSIARGTQLTVMGRMSSTGHTRELTDVYITTGGSANGDPVLLTSRDVGGSDFFYEPGPPVQGQKGTPWGRGPNNVGLTAVVFGRVISSDPGVFYISDGCPMPSSLPIKYISEITPPAMNAYVRVTGLVEADGILVLRQEDILTLQ